MLFLFIVTKKIVDPNNSTLKNAIIKYGGWYNTFSGGAEAKGGAVTVNGANVTIKNSLFENNLYAGLELINSSSEITDTIFNKHTAEYFWGALSVGIMVASGDCPNLSSVIFGTEDNANSTNIYPTSCLPAD